MIDLIARYAIGLLALPISANGNCYDMFMVAKKTLISVVGTEFVHLYIIDLGGLC